MQKSIEMLMQYTSYIPKRQWTDFVAMVRCEYNRARIRAHAHHNCVRIRITSSNAERENREEKPTDWNWAKQQQQQQTSRRNDVEKISNPQLVLYKLWKDRLKIAFIGLRLCAERNSTLNASPSNRSRRGDICWMPVQSGAVKCMLDYWMLCCTFFSFFRCHFTVASTNAKWISFPILR